MEYNNTRVNTPQKEPLYKRAAVRVAIASALTALSPLAVFAKESSDSLVGATSCNFLPAGLCPANGDINAVIGGAANFLVEIFGAVFVLMIVVAGVQMTSAGDSPDRLKAAKSRLTNAIIGLVFLVLMRAILALLGIRI